MLDRKKPTIFVGMSHSSHVEMWLKNFAKTDRPIYFIESTDNQPNLVKLQDSIKDITVIPNKSISFIEKKYIKRVFPDKDRQKIYEIAYQLKMIIADSELLVVHIMEFQHAGYMFCDVFKLLTLNEKEKIRIVSTNYGSDIYWYKNSDNHLKKINELLMITKVLISESQRDKNLAVSLGYRGENLIVNSNAVGFPDEDFAKVLKSESRVLKKYIFVKGNFGFVGRPFAAIDLLCELSQIIKRQDLQIIIVSVPAEIRDIIANQLAVFDLQYKIFGGGELTRQEIFSFLSQSLIYLGFSLSDGLSTTVIESMACGAIPFQTKSSTIFEWDSDITCYEVDLNNLDETKRNLVDTLENRKNNSEIIRKNKIFIQNNFLTSVVKKRISQSTENLYD